MKTKMKLERSPVSFRHSVVTKLLGWVLFFYLVVSTVVTAVHMVSEYRRVEDNVIQDLKSFYLNLNPTLAVALWEADSEQMQSILSGTIQSPTIFGIKISDISGGYIRTAGDVIEPGDALQNKDQDAPAIRIDSKKSEHFGYQFPIIHSELEQKHQIGKVTFYSSSAIIFDRVKYSYLFVIINAIVKIVVLWIVFMWFSRLLLQRPLARLTSFCKEMELDNIGNVRVDTKADGKDELAILANALNAMVQKLLGSQTLLRNYNEELEKEVLERTKELQTSQAELKAIFAGMTDIVLMLDDKGRYLKIAPTSPDLSYKPDEALIGKTVHDVFPKPQADIFLDQIDQSLKRRQTISTEYSLDIRGEKLWFDARISPMSEGIVVHVARDISTRKEAEKRMQQSQEIEARSKKMESLGLLAGGVAHDLNNILSGIVSYPEILLIDIPDESPLKKPLITIQKSGERAVEIVQDLLTMARRGVSVTEVIKVNQIISNQLKSPEMEKLKSYHTNVEVSVDLETDLLNVKGSSTHLSKSIMNLISNAAEAMPHGGKIVISTCNRYLDTPVKGYEYIEEGDYVKILISDSGTGLPNDDIEKIFEPFYTKKKMGRSGTGLGMAVVWGTVKDHRGYIDIQSLEGKGTTFTIYLPVTREKLKRHGSEIPFEEYNGNGESILIIDDVEEQREIASIILKKLGYSVSSVSGGEEACEYLKNNSADLLVLDMIMEPGIDGFDTYKKIIEFHPKQKAIIASGFSRTDRVKELQRLGAGQYIKKPYALGKIGFAVKKELGK